MHFVLYSRGLYPSLLFEHCVVYGVPVRVCAEERLREYVRRALEGMRAWLEEGQVERVSVVVYDEKGDRREAFSVALHRGGQQGSKEGSAMEWRAFFRGWLVGCAMRKECC